VNIADDEGCEPPDLKRTKSDPIEGQDRKRAPQKCTACGFYRFTYPGHTNEGWCPVLEQWGSRSRCALCRDLRTNVPGHTPDGFCPVRKAHSETMRKRWTKKEKKRKLRSQPEAAEEEETASTP